MLQFRRLILCLMNKICRSTGSFTDLLKLLCTDMLSRVCQMVLFYPEVRTISLLQNADMLDCRQVPSRFAYKIINFDADKCELLC